MRTSVEVTLDPAVHDQLPERRRFHRGRPGRTAVQLATADRRDTCEEEPARTSDGVCRGSGIGC